jgi:hypothetical protein
MQIDALDAMIEEKNKRIAELEYKIAKASEAFDAASRAFTACDIKRYNRIKELKAQLAKTMDSAQRVFHEVEQTLGKALGYPWYKDDPDNFPDATEADGVCVGEHVPESIALEAANTIARKGEVKGTSEDVLKRFGLGVKRRALAFSIWTQVHMVLYDRRGFDDWWDGLDGGIADEINDVVIETIKDEMEDC